MYDNPNNLSANVYYCYQRSKHKHWLLIFILDTKKQSRYFIFLLSAKQISFNYKQLDQNIHSHHIIINFSNKEDSLRLALSGRGGISALKSLQYCQEGEERCLATARSSNTVSEFQDISTSKSTKLEANLEAAHSCRILQRKCFASV